MPVEYMNSDVGATNKLAIALEDDPYSEQTNIKLKQTLSFYVCYSTPLPGPF